MVTGKAANARVLLVLSVLLLTVACDQGTKRWARATLHPGSTQDLLRGHVQLTLAENRGGFLSLGDRLPPAIRFAVFTILVWIGLMGGAAWLMRFTGRPRQLIAVALLVGGGMSNLIDRIVSHGAVTDFMVIRLGVVHTGVFNMADVFITGAVVAIVASELTRKQKEPPTTGAASAQP